MTCYLPSTLSFSSSLLHLTSCKAESSASIDANFNERSLVCCFLTTLKVDLSCANVMGQLISVPKMAEIDEVRDAVLVTNGDSEIGEMVILSLIMKRARVKALVKDKRAALEAFGTYVEEGFISDVKSLGGVEHVILLSQLSVYKIASCVQAMLTGNAKRLAEQDEEILISSGVPYTIIQVGSLKDTPGGQQGFNFEKGSAIQGSLSKEDAAFICVEALDAVPQTGLVFEEINGEEKVSSWKVFLRNLIQKAENQQGAQ